MNPKFEEKLFTYINMIRQKPTDFIKYLKERELEYDGNSYVYRKATCRVVTHEDVSAVTEAIAFLEKSRPILPFEKDKKLYNTAKEQGTFLIEQSIVTHKGQFNKEPEQRIVAAMGRGSVAEYMVINEPKAKHVAINLLVDDGLKDRPNRQLITSKDFGHIGIYGSSHPSKGYIVVTQLWGSPVARFNYKFPPIELSDEPWYLN